jgi:predicted negative regulator of RcsB-dependent stress response
MPTYKQRPVSKKEREEKLPLYRPIDSLAFQVAENRKKLLPFVLLAVVAFALFGGFKAYKAHFESKASELLEKNELEAVARDYGNSKAAQVARIRLGKSAMDAKEFDRAVDWYAPVASDTSAPALLRIAAKQNLALAYLKKGDAAKAAALLDDASEDPANSSNDYTKLLLAYVQETSGHKDKALEIYKILADGSKEASVKAEAQARTKWLEPATPSSVTALIVL